MSQHPKPDDITPPYLLHAAIIANLIKAGLYFFGWPACARDAYRFDYENKLAERGIRVNKI